MFRKTLPKADVVATADAFAKTGELLLAQRPAGFEWPHPFVVNTALSIELYLKSFLAEDDLVTCYTSDDGVIVYMGFTKCLSHEHKLELLYEKIPAKIKILLEAEFCAGELASSYSSLEEALTKFSNAFVEARYPYEERHSKGHCITDLVNISKFLKQAILRIGEVSYARLP